jgi:GAF domain-containing protein/HAMP domain-containing protein
MANPIFAPVQAYTSALEGRATTSQVRSGLQSYALLSVPVRDQSGNVIGVIDIIFDQSNAIAGLWQRVIIILLFVLAGLIVLTFSLGFSVWYMLKPIRELTCAAQAIEKGDLSYNIPEPQKSRWKLIFAEDEIGKLAKSFKAMTQQFQGLLVNLERTVASRTRDLERRSLQLQVASEIARDVTMTTDLEQLLKQAVELIRERFGLYYVGIFLLDAEGENARLAAATGEAGRLMLASGYRQKVGQAGLVGAVTNSGAARLVLNFDESTAQFRNTLLPDTQSEMALPLRIGEQLIGALDVQSHRANAFDEQDITTMQIVADQLTVAIENARLVHQLNETVAELEQAYGSYTQESWRTFIQQRVRALGYRYRKVEQRSVFLESHDLAHEAQLALHQGQMIVQEAIIDADGSMHSSLAVPMRLREQVIGVLNLRFESEKIDPEVASLIEEAAARVSLVLESARLLQEAQRLAAREAQINWIASQVRGAASLETILQNTVRELGKALGASRTYIHIGGATVEQLPPDVNGSQTSGNGAGADDNGRYPHRDPDLSSPPEGQPGDSEP